MVVGRCTVAADVPSVRRRVRGTPDLSAEGSRHFSRFVVTGMEVAEFWSSPSVGVVAGTG